MNGLTSSDVINIPKVLIGVLGYEARSSQFLLSENLEVFKEIIVFDYKSHGLHSYEANEIVLESRLGDRAKKYTKPAELIEELDRLCIEHQRSGLSLAIDFSSIDRGLISEIILLMYRNRAIVSDFEVLYYPQKFSKPHTKLDTVTKFGPLSPEFSGSSRSSSQKLCMIVGSGYEFGKVVGAQDRLEPDETYVFSPVGKDERFEAAIEKANYGFEFIGDADNVIKYDLSAPEDTFGALFELVRHKKASHRVLLLPMGPKIFAVFSLLVAVHFHPDVRVWHYSTHRDGGSGASNAFASDQRISLRFTSSAIFG